MNTAAGVLVGFAAGSIPTGYWMGRLLRGIDIRTVGSGNVGATNVFRSVGRTAGLATLALDMAKGFGPVWFVAHGSGGEPAALLTGLAAVAGHTFSPWVGFRGGKGVATSAGVFLALLPGPMAAALLVFVLGLVLTRRVSVGSMAGAVTLPLAAWAIGAPPMRLGLAVVLGAVVVLRHMPNLRRLWRGEEPPLVFSSKKGGLS